MGLLFVRIKPSVVFLKERGCGKWYSFISCTYSHSVQATKGGRAGKSLETKIAIND